MPKLDRSYYLRPNVIEVARDLIGKVLVTRFEGTTTSGMISETEAYAGTTDRASHAFNGRRTPRNEVMYAAGGSAYVYLCYGIHHLFNVVTNSTDIPHAVLIRAIHPLEGGELMRARRKGKAPLSTGGPGMLSQALGIRTTHNGMDLTGDDIWIEDRSIAIRDERIIVGPRVGVDYAGRDALLPYRFRYVPHKPA
jgi:DNA-3-methyladenine glycosylase